MYGILNTGAVTTDIYKQNIIILVGARGHGPWIPLNPALCHEAINQVEAGHLIECI